MEPHVITAATKPLIWILDDSALEGAMARRVLSTTYDVQVFTDGHMMLEQLAAGATPAVLVLDLRLPGMSGIETCRFLRSRYDASALPILMLTVYGHKSDVVEGFEAGANDYLTKPYEPTELVARVGTLARMKQLFESVKVADAARDDLLSREREARRDAEAANTAKDEFLAMVSHELRTPLNAILGWARLLRTDEVSAEQRTRAFDTIERNAVAQARLIEDLLDTSRILSGTFRIEPESVDMVNVINLAVDAIRPLAEKKRVRLHVTIESNGSRVLGDPARLQQVVDNLLTNAIKFTPAEGNVRLSLASREGKVEIAIRDDGRGIDPSFLPHVFDRFRQGDGGRKRAHGGLGLGLAIVRRIVDLHAGSVVAESEGTGLGATFRVILPVATSGAPPALSRPLRESEPTTNALAGVRVVAVDDEPDALELVCTLLQHAGATVFAASSARAALALVDAEKPNVIVSDIGMPEQDGNELVTALRARPADKSGRIPAVALTAFAGSEDRRRAFAAGFTAYLAKPVDPIEFMMAVCRTIGR
jgi:signal transduction histidine kinase